MNENGKTAVIRAKLKYPDIEAFISGYSRNISKFGVFFKTPKPKDEGTSVKFEIKIADDSTVLRGIGEVAWKRDDAENGNPPGMGIKFLKLDGASRETVKKVLIHKKEADDLKRSRYSEVPLPSDELSSRLQEQAEEAAAAKRAEEAAAAKRAEEAAAAKRAEEAAAAKRAEEAAAAKRAEEEHARKVAEKIALEQRSAKIEADEDEIDDVIAAFDSIQMPDEIAPVPLPAPSPSPVIEPVTAKSDEMDIDSLIHDELEEESEEDLFDEIMGIDSDEETEDETTQISTGDSDEKNSVEVADSSTLFSSENDNGFNLDEESDELFLPDDESSDSLSDNLPEDLPEDLSGELEAEDEILADDEILAGDDDFEADEMSDDEESGFLDADEFLITESDDEMDIEMSSTFTIDDLKDLNTGDIEVVKAGDKSEDRFNSLIDDLTRESISPAGEFKNEPLIEKDAIGDELDDIFMGESKPSPRKSEREKNLEMIASAPEVLPDDAVPSDLLNMVQQRKSLAPPPIYPQTNAFDQPVIQAGNNLGDDEDWDTSKKDKKKKGFLGKLFGK
ncbi:MAG: TIGR02266 family protein [Deltaproteobacteria bacterium]|nr:TIGR02266 family protein [Deltaproteobacteria bacterium]